VPLMAPAGVSVMVGTVVVAPARALTSRPARASSVFGAVPRTAVWDQEGCIGQWRQGRQVLTRAFEGVAGSCRASNTQRWAAASRPPSTPE